MNSEVSANTAMKAETTTTLISAMVNNCMARSNLRRPHDVYNIVETCMAVSSLLRPRNVYNVENSFWPGSWGDTLELVSVELAMSSSGWPVWKGLLSQPGFWLANFGPTGALAWLGWLGWAELT